MDLAHVRFAPVWSSNRGLQMMASIALGSVRIEPIAVVDLDGLRRAVQGAKPEAVILAWDEARAVGLDLPALRRVIGEAVPVVLLGVVPAADVGHDPNARSIRIPFTTKDLVQAVAREHGPAVFPMPPPTSPVAPARREPMHEPAPAAGADLVREEIARQVAEITRRAIEETVRKVVPELAETLIKEELARILRVSDEAAVQDPPDRDE